MKEFVLLLSISLGFASRVGADDEIGKDQVPAAVLEAFAKDFPRAHAVRFKMDSDDGVKIYEVKFREGRRKIKAEYSASGQRLTLKGKKMDDDDD